MAPGATPVLHGLAGATGGFAVPGGGPAAAGTALAAVGEDLARQYYLRFVDPDPLPGVVAITGTDGFRATVSLPTKNPQAPPALSSPPASAARPFWDRGLTGAAALMVILSLCYGAGILIASRREPRRRAVMASRARPATND